MTVLLQRFRSNEIRAFEEIPFKGDTKCATCGLNLTSNFYLDREKDLLYCRRCANSAMFSKKGTDVAFPQIRDIKKINGDLNS